MLRNGASASAFRALARPLTHPPRTILPTRVKTTQWHSSFSSLSSTKLPLRPQMPQLRPVQAIVFRRTLADKIDKEAEKRYQHEKLEPTPETVTTTSTTRPALSEVGDSEEPRDIDMMKGVRQDIETVKDTFNLSAVPRQAYYLGLAGVLPYLATSLSTVFCAWNINHAADVGTTILLSPATAETLLQILEPIQIGYGAVILSFLGAIHWGLEFAGYGGHHGYKRYAIGVLAPAVAWPTMMLSVEYALISQFGAFVLLYYADTRATYRGWTPPWYAIYRFVLTFIVGASIMVSLIGRGEVANRVKRIPGAVERATALKDDTAQTLGKEEEAIHAQEDRVQAEEKSDESSEEE